MKPAIPASGDYWLCRARLPDGRALVDLRIAGGTVAAIAPAGAAPAGVDLAGGQVWPCFVDVHTHLDKGHIWRRTPNPDGTFAGALAAVAADRPRWTEADLRLRMEYGLACAHAHGTAAIRTHLDSDHVNAANAWRVFRALRDEWAGRIALQAASICALETYDGEGGRALADQVAEAGGVLGGVTRLGGSFDAPLPDGFQDRLDQLFALAEARGLDIDLHVDESGEAGARALREIARTALHRGFGNRIQCGHCCSLSVQPKAFARETIAAVAEAGIAVVTLPMCNMYLQDRAASRTPRWRGVTLAHELRAAGVPVSIASDNCGDPFYPYGDHDMLEVLREATRILHLDHSPSWSAAVHATPARLMGLDAGGVRVGAPADLVLFSARHPHELLARPQSDRVVLRRGRALDAALPDPAMLDGLAPTHNPTKGVSA
jgi:cytosine deaminase